MKKRFAAVLAAAAIVGATSAFAANPFSDVTPADWAYQAVSQLASAGIINGYPDGTFQGEKDVTRYEIAQMVAKAMAHEYRANAEQQAIINQLAAEFAGELNTLGVRVDNVEAKLGNVRVSGDARFHYENHNGTATKPEKDTYSQRVRLNLRAEVDAKTYVASRLKAEFAYGEGQGSNEVLFDQLYAGHDFGSVQVMAGRLPLFVGDGLVFDDQFDGVVATTMLDKVAVSVGYGYQPDFKVNADDKSARSVNATVVYGQLNAPLAKNVSVGAYVLDYSASGENKALVVAGDGAALNHNVYGATLDAQLSKGLALSAEYAKRNVGNDLDKDAKGREAWVAGLTYGNYDMAQKGSANLAVQYFRLGENSPLVSTTYDLISSANMKGWAVEGNYALVKNLGLSVRYAFNAEQVKGDENLGNKVWANLQYQF